MAEPVHIYDTTLRDGMQREGISLSVSEKLQVAHLLDRLGCAYIEAGFPASNPKDWELFEQLEQETFQTARVAAFGMTRRKDIRASDDEALRVLVECFAPVITLVGKTWDLHLDKVVRVSREENLAMIGDSVRFCVEQGKEVVYDAEHFFDGYAADRDYALRCLRTAAEAGASNVTMCDTNGATLPAQVAAAVADVHAALGGDVALGIHTHNDAECAVANSVAAVEAGARLVQGTLNGYGERCGNANLIAIIPSLEIKLGYACIGPERLARLSQISHEAAEICNLQPDAHAAYVGRSAFAHKGGMHVAGMQADVRTFEHIDPAVVGNSRTVLVSELSGKGTVREKAAEFGVELDAAGVDRALERLKVLEHRGYAFEAADASFELLLRTEAGEIEPLFDARGPARDHREARRRPRRDRGHHQAARARRARRADRRGQRSGERARHRAAHRADAATTPSSAGSSWRTTRCASSTRTAAPAPSRASSSIRRTATTSGRRWACRRTSSRRRGKPWSRASRTACACA